MLHSNQHWRPGVLSDKISKLLVAQIIVYDQISNIETISNNIKKKCFENYLSYFKNNRCSINFADGELNVRYNEEQKRKSLSSHNIMKNDCYTMSTDYSSRCVNTDNEFDETACYNNSNAFQTKTDVKNDQINIVESGYYENKNDLSLDYLNQKLGQSYSDEIKYDTSNNSLNVIINESGTEKEINGVAHLLKTSICDTGIVDIIKFNINPDLSIEQKEKLNALLARHVDCFASRPMDLGAIDIGDIPILTVSNDPVSLAPFRLSLSSQKKLQRQVDEFLDARLFVSSNLAYASPAFLVDKADDPKEW